MELEKRYQQILKKIDLLINGYCKQGVLKEMKQYIFKYYGQPVILHPNIYSSFILHSKIQSVIIGKTWPHFNTSSDIQKSLDIFFKNKTKTAYFHGFCENFEVVIKFVNNTGGCLCVFGKDGDVLIKFNQITEGQEYSRSKTGWKCFYSKWLQIFSIGFSCMDEDINIMLTINNDFANYIVLTDSKSLCVFNYWNFVVIN